jgi:diguanylate cyclase (GGDEF)-like protein
MAMGETLGALHVFVKPSTTEQWGDSVNRLAMPVARLIGSALSGVLLREFFRSQAIRDPLTGLFNRRYMQESLEREAHRSIRHGQSIGIVMLDIDHFKRTNDHFGHEMGDALLAALGRLLKERTRTEDIACRYGGEEFLLILPGAGLEITRQRAEQLREQAKTLRVELRGQVFQGMTVSMGIAAFPEHGTTVEDVLRAADKALYEAKTEGRDRVALAHNDAYGKG